MKNKREMILSTLSKTWIFDLDGTIVKHNGYKTETGDVLLPNAKSYLEALPHSDKIIFLTARTEEFKEETLKFLKESGIRYDEILFNMPVGERIVINDKKPSGLDMAIAINIERDCFEMPETIRKK